MSCKHLGATLSRDDIVLLDDRRQFAAGEVWMLLETSPCFETYAILADASGSIRHTSKLILRNFEKV